VSPRRSSARGTRRGRSVVALALLGFVLVAASVIWRRAYGASRALELDRLRTRVQQLESERERLVGEIVDAESRRRMVPLVEQRLGMRVPNDSQIIILPPIRRPAPDDSAKAAPTRRDPR
jgi:hypothetical protein